VLSRLTERWSYPPLRAKRLVAVSDGVAAEPRRYLPRMAPVVSVIPTGVDTGAFPPDREARRLIRRRLGIGTGERVAVFVARDGSFADCVF
jgi:hypothetical protein